MNTRHSQISELRRAVAKLEASEFQFIPLGDAIQPVILRLSSDLPRIRCEPISTLRRETEETGSLS